MIALADLIDTHRGAFEYDWRARFQLPVSSIGDAMTWGEAVRHTDRLAADPSSAIGAALAGWDYPVGYDALAVMNLFDLMHEIAWAQGGKKGSRPKPHPRPWSDRKTRRAKPTVSQEEVIAALRSAGHMGPIPTRAG